MWGGPASFAPIERAGRGVGVSLSPRCSLKMWTGTTTRVSNDLHCAFESGAAGPFREDRNFTGKTSARGVTVDPAIGSLLGILTSRGLTGRAVSGNRKWRSPSGDVRDGWPAPPTSCRPLRSLGSSAEEPSPALQSRCCCTRFWDLTLGVAWLS